MKLLSGIAAALALSASLLAIPATAGPPTYPFGARLDSYQAGIKVTGISNVDGTIKAHYIDWRNARLRDVPSVAGAKADAMGNGTIVSEGMGYAMLITVVMAGADPGISAQADFDALLKLVRARTAFQIGVGKDGQCAYSSTNPTFCSTYDGRYLMDWRLDANGNSTGGGYNALDGDLDIALALLMADRQWGSTGTWNYKQEAINTINAMKAWNLRSDGTTWGCTAPDISRTSDYMIGHFRAFAKATGDSFWSTTAIDRAYSLINLMQTSYSSAGLMPDFIWYTDTSSPRPASGTYRCDQGSTTEGDYFANAQRNPWRWGTDYVYSGDARWKGVLTRMMQFFTSPQGGGDPAHLADGYHLDGSRMEFGWPPRGIVAGAMSAAQADPAYQSFLNAAWTWVDQNWVTDYYDSELMLLPMLVASGNWWTPGSTPPSPPPTPTGSKVQAESGTISGTGVGVKNDVAGYEGSGFVGSFTNDGDRLTVAVGAQAAGTFSINIRYHAWTDQLNNVSINGAAPTSQSFPATGSAWATKTITGVALATGSNTVAILKDWGYMDVDYVEIVPSGTGGGGITDATIQAESSDTVTYSGSGVQFKNDVAGYEGTGFLGSFTADGDQMTATFSGFAAGTYTVSIRYHAWTDQQNTVVINGNATTQYFPATGGGWAVKTITGVTVPGGSTTVKFVKDWGYTDIDSIRLAP